MKTLLKKSALASVFLIATHAHATNGYFLPGFGVKSQGAGGVGVALQADSLSQAANPANAAHTGMRGDLGLSLFNPERSSTTGPDLGGNNEGGFGFGATSQSGNRLYLMPDMGFTMPIDDRLSVGFALVGNGGMNTTYKENIFASPDLAPQAEAAGYGGAQPDSLLGVDLMQILAPVTVAYKLTPEHSVGISLNLAAQRFKANGLGQFAFFGISSDTDNMTNNGYDYSYGAGVRLGWLGKFMNDRVSLGVTWASRTYMTEFEEYKGLFAERGDFDIPENYGLGFAVKPTEKLTVAADYVKIKYSDVAAVGNPGPGVAGGSGYSQQEIIFMAFGLALQDRLLGMANGMGFGWQDMDIYKLGIIYDATDRLTLRAGYNYGKSPIRDDQLVFSALAPATVEKHYSIGFTYQMKGELDWEISGTYMRVANNRQEGCNQAVVDCVSYEMHQNILGIGFGIKY